MKPAAICGAVIAAILIGFVAITNCLTSSPWRGLDVTPKLSKQERRDLKLKSWLDLQNYICGLILEYVDNLGTVRILLSIIKLTSLDEPDIEGAHNLVDQIDDEMITVDQQYALSRLLKTYEASLKGD